MIRSAGRRLGDHAPTVVLAGAQHLDVADGTDVADVASSSVADADVVITVGYADCFVVALIQEEKSK